MPGGTHNDELHRQHGDKQRGQPPLAAAGGGRGTICPTLRGKPQRRPYNCCDNKQNGVAGKAAVLVGEGKRPLTKDEHAQNEGEHGAGAQACQYRQKAEETVELAHGGTLLCCKMEKGPE